jgi:hypothetical protein
LVEDSAIVKKGIKHIHNGRGMIEFTPKRGKFYTLHVRKGKEDKQYKEFKLPTINDKLTMIA